jgi:hypothetical protein
VFFFNYRGFLSAHTQAISKSEFSDEELSDSTITGDSSACLGSLDNVVDFPISLYLSDLFLIYFLGFLRVVFRAERPPTFITLLTNGASDLMTLDFTLLDSCGLIAETKSTGEVIIFGMGYELEET